jgi:hypothetical protein
MPTVTHVPDIGTYLCCGKRDYESYTDEIHKHTNQLAETFLKLNMPFSLASEFHCTKN